MIKNSLKSLVGSAEYLFVIIWFVSMLISFLELYFYPGFTKNHLFVNPIFVYLLLGTVGLRIPFSSKWDEDAALRIFKKLNYLAIAFFGLLYISMNIVENITYQNYVFSTFHIRPDQLLTPFCLTILTSLIVSKQIFGQKVGGIKKALFNPKILIALFILWITVPDITETGATVAQNFVFMIKHPTATYDQKMEEKVGKIFYDYTMFVKNNTPEDAKILLPPFPAYPWPQTGNIPYIRYFLYPRELLNGQEYSSGHDLKKEQINYVLLDWGETSISSGTYSHGWPKFDVDSSEIIYWHGDSNTTTKMASYNYKDVAGQELWGIIKVKK